LGGRKNRDLKDLGGYTEAQKNAHPLARISAGEGKEKIKTDPDS